MHTNSAVNQFLKMVFQSNPEQGYFLTNNPATQWEHIFCGFNDVPNAFCPNCQQLLLRFLSLNTSDDRFHLTDAPFPRLSLLYCWTCQLAQDHFYYEQKDGSIEILYFRKGESYDDFPYENYPLYFPETKVDLQPIPKEDQEIIKALNYGQSDFEIRKTRPGLCKPKHQIGGEPFLVQPDIKKKVQCLNCQSAMPFFAAIGDEGPEKMSFAMNSFVQVLFHYCRKCNVVAAYHEVD